MVHVEKSSDNATQKQQQRRRIIDCINIYDGNGNVELIIVLWLRNGK